MNKWYTIVAWGKDPRPAKGPYKTRDEAEMAIERFRVRLGALAGTYMASGSVRIVGPYLTRADARRASIHVD